MDAAYASLIVSGVGILSMLAVKYYQLRSGKAIYLANLRVKSDRYIKAKVAKVKVVTHTVGTFSFSFVMKFLCTKLAVGFFRIAKMFRAISIRFLDMAKRHADLREKGSVSFFLKHITDHKRGSKTETEALRVQVKSAPDETDSKES